MTNNEAIEKKDLFTVRKMVLISMMSAVALIIYLLDFNVPLMPGFIKLDLSNVISLLASFSMGPVEGVMVCLIKNLIHLIIKGYASTMGVGNIFDFVTSAAFAFTAGVIYQKNRTKKGALIGSIVGAVVFTVISLPLNYFIVYPFYFKLFAKYGGEAGVLGMYQAILPSTGSILQALLIFNLPFTLIKGALCAAVTGVIYKPLSPIIKGRR